MDQTFRKAKQQNYIFAFLFSVYECRTKLKNYMFFTSEFYWNFSSKSFEWVLDFRLFTGAFRTAVPLVRTVCAASRDCPRRAGTGSAVLGRGVSLQAAIGLAGNQAGKLSRRNVKFQFSMPQTTPL